MVSVYSHNVYHYNNFVPNYVGSKNQRQMATFLLPKKLNSEGHNKKHCFVC